MASAFPMTISPSTEFAAFTETPRATGFIVTIYGDVAVPRGGTLWMGTLIDCCAAHGISESLVRTAVSRLVTSGRLIGERLGRRSYYRLSDAARAEFGHAAQILYAPPPLPIGWLVAMGGNGPAPDWPVGWVSLSPGIAIAPNRGDIAHPPCVVMSAETIEGEEGLPAFAAACWPVAEVARGYADFVCRYDGLAPALSPSASDAEALALRLRLVHDFRHAALADPRLPQSALPPGWQAPKARRIFVESYLLLSGAADAHIGRSFHDSHGLLAEHTIGTVQRMDRLRREAAR